MTENSRKRNTSWNITLYLICFIFFFLLLSEQAPEKQEEESTSSPAGPLPQNDTAIGTVNQHNSIVEVKDILQLKVSLKE